MFSVAPISSKPWFKRSLVSLSSMPPAFSYECKLVICLAISWSQSELQLPKFLCNTILFSTVLTISSLFFAIRSNGLWILSIVSFDNFATCNMYTNFETMHMLFIYDTCAIVILFVLRLLTVARTVSWALDLTSDSFNLQFS